MSLDFWPGTGIRRSTHNGFTMGLSGDWSAEFIATLKPSPMARANPGNRGRAKRAVEQLTPAGEFVREFPSISEAAIAADVPCPNIVRVASGLRNTAGGYRWRYATTKATQ